MATKKEDIVRSEADRKVVTIKPCYLHDSLAEVLLRIDERVGKLLELIEKGHKPGVNQ